MNIYKRVVEKYPGVYKIRSERTKDLEVPEMLSAGFQGTLPLVSAFIV